MRTFPVPANGRIAQRQGHPSGNNPFQKGTQSYKEWKAEWKKAYKENKRG